MRNISCKLDDLKKIVLPIGYEGENDHTRVQVDAGEVFKEYPAAVPSLKVHGPGGTIYPAEVTRDGKNVIWDIKASDCAADGSGEAQITFTLNNVIVKSCIAKIKVYRSIVGGSTPPDPVQDWIDDAEEVLDDLEAMDNIAKTAEAGDVGKALSPKTVVDGVVTEWQYVEPGAGTEDYTDLENKPKIGGVELSGDKSLHDLGIAAESAIPDVSGKANLSVVAPAFVQETANDAGSLVTYTDGVVYVLPEGHTAGTTWANTQKTATNIAEQQRLLKSEIDGLQDNVEDIDEILNGGPAPAVITMPSGYKSANYSNVAGTLKYKWENNKLVLSKSNGSSGEINTGNASLTIGDSLAYIINPAENPKMVFTYENANNANIAGILLRFCRYDRYDYYKGVHLDIPVGTGTAEIDLVTLAAQNDVNLTTHYRLVIRGIELYSGAQSYSTAIVGISGYVVSGGREQGLVDHVEELTEKTERTANENTYLIRQNVPSYYFADPVSPASFDDMPYLEDAIDRVPEGKSFIYVTDTHWESNTKNTFKLIQYVKNRLGIRKVLFGGDCIDRGTNKYVGLNLIRNYMNIAVDALGKDYIPTIGNHDTNMGNALNDNLDDPTYRIPYDQIYKVYLSHLEGDIQTEDWSETITSIAQSDTDAAELTGWTKLHYYIDDAKDKTRYIVIYSSAYDLTLVPTYTGFSTDGGGGPTTVMQYEWFARTLMSTPVGYDIIVLAHCADAENKTFPERQLLRNYFDFFVRIASAFHKKCSGYKIDVSNFSEEGCPTNAFWTRETKQWDFTSAPTVGKILFMAGHIHKNVEYVSRIETDSNVYPTYERGKARNNGNPALVGIEEGVEVFDNATVDFDAGEMLTIISQNDAYNRVPQNKYPYESETMTQGTVTEQSFDVITLTDSGVVCTRFGAGWDRMIPVKWLPSN